MSLKKYSKPLSFLAKLALMLAAFWLVLHDLSIEDLKSLLREQNRTALLEAIFLLILQIFFGAVRWRYIVSALNTANSQIISWISMLKTFYISIFFNCCLPGTVGGDVVRVFLIKSDHTPLPTAISSVVIDRLIALLALGVMGGITLPFLIDHIPISGWLIIPAFLLISAISCWILLNLERIISLVPLLSSLTWLEHLLSNINKIIRTPRAALISLCYAILAHFAYSISAYILADSLGHPISIIESLTLIPWVMLISIIPISIGGWGLREAAMVFFLGLVGVPQAAALTISIQQGLMLILISLPAGILWLVNRKKNPLS